MQKEAEQELGEEELENDTSEDEEEHVEGQKDGLDITTNRFEKFNITDTGDDINEEAPIEKIDNRKKNPPVVEKEETENNIAEEVESNEKLDGTNEEEKVEIHINTQDIIKNVKMKLNKRHQKSGINTRKRNIVKSKAKKDIRDVVQSSS